MVDRRDPDLEALDPLDRRAALELYVRRRSYRLAEDVQVAAPRCEREVEARLEGVRVQSECEIRRGAPQCRFELAKRLGEAFDVCSVAGIGDVQVQVL